MMALATRTPRSPAPRIGRADAAPPAPADQPNVTDALTRAVILEAHDLTKTYPLGQTTVDALRGVSLAVRAGEFVALMGPSGSGKSTLLQVLGGLDQPSTGTVVLEGETISTLSDDRATRLRRDRTGFVFQSFNLIPLLDVTENVALPFTIAGEDPTRGELADRDFRFATLALTGAANAIVYDWTLREDREDSAALEAQLTELALDLLAR